MYVMYVWYVVNMYKYDTRHVCYTGTHTCTADEFELCYFFKKKTRNLTGPAPLSLCTLHMYHMYIYSTYITYIHINTCMYVYVMYVCSMYVSCMYMYDEAVYWY
jgi:hypothetical protein